MMILSTIFIVILAAITFFTLGRLLRNEDHKYHIEQYEWYKKRYECVSEEYDELRYKYLAVVRNLSSQQFDANFKPLKAKYL